MQQQKRWHKSVRKLSAFFNEKKETPHFLQIAQLKSISFILHRSYFNFNRKLDSHALLMYYNIFHVFPYGA